ncbi:MAG: hypothetical protein ACFCUW_09970 [Kiloniellaceae bacterium]
MFAVLAGLAAAQPVAAAELDFARLGENIDLALQPGSEPVGELVANVAVGPVQMNLHHLEFLGGMGRPYLYGRPQDNPLVRSSLLDGGTRLDLGAQVAMPLGVSLGFDEWDRGNHDLRLVLRNGLELPFLQVEHRLTATTSYAADGSETRRAAGRLALGFDLFGGRQEGVVNYDATPLAQVSDLGINSQWRFDGGAAAVVGLAHRPLEGISEARLGFRQPVGAFEVTTDMVADNAGGYAVGVRFALPLGPAPQRESWSLSGLVSALRAERRPALPTEGDTPLLGSGY